MSDALKDTAAAVRTLFEQRVPSFTATGVEPYYAAPAAITLKTAADIQAMISGTAQMVGDVLAGSGKGGVAELSKACEKAWFLMAMSREHARCGRSRIGLVCDAGRAVKEALRIGDADGSPSGFIKENIENIGQ